MLILSFVLFLILNRKNRTLSVFGNSVRSENLSKLKLDARWIEYSIGNEDVYWMLALVISLSNILIPLPFHLPETELSKLHWQNKEIRLKRSTFKLWYWFNSECISKYVKFVFGSSNDGKFSSLHYAMLLSLLESIHNFCVREKLCQHFHQTTTFIL